MTGLSTRQRMSVTTLLMTATLLTLVLGVDTPVEAETTTEVAAIESVLLLGDSIAQEIREPLQTMLGATAIGLESITFNGIAPCDLFVSIQDEPARSVFTSEPDVVIMLYTGNAVTPCMDGARDIEAVDYFDRYLADSRTITSSFPDKTVVLSVGPLPASDERRTTSNARLATTLASDPNVDHVVDIWDWFADENGDYATELTCLVPGEPCPTVRVRAFDGGHLGDDDSDNVHGRRRLALALTLAIDELQRAT